MKNTLTLLTAALLLNSLAPAAGFSVTTIDFGGNRTYARGINDAGQITGYYTDSAGNFHGFLDNNGIFTTLDAPGANFTQAFGIGADGTVAGGASTGGFLYSNGTFTPVTGTGGSFSSIYGINSAGELLLSNGTSTFTKNGAVYTPVQDPAGSGGTNGQGINDSGEIVGQYIDAASHIHSFLYDGTQFTDFVEPAAGSHGTTAYGINNRGDIVGQYGFTGFVDIGGTFTDLVIPGAFAVWATGINNSDQVVGFFNDNSGTHGFLATPVTGVAAVPEPGAWGLSIAPVCALIAASRRFRRQ